MSGIVLIKDKIAIVIIIGVLITNSTRPGTDRIFVCRWGCPPSHSMANSLDTWTKSKLTEQSRFSARRKLRSAVRGAAFVFGATTGAVCGLRSADLSYPRDVIRSRIVNTFPRTSYEYIL